MSATKTHHAGRKTSEAKAQANEQAEAAKRVKARLRAEAQQEGREVADRLTTPDVPTPARPPQHRAVIPAPGVPRPAPQPRPNTRHPGRHTGHPAQPKAHASAHSTPKPKQHAAASSSLAGQHVVLLLSGGLDSAVLLWQLSREGAIVHPLVVDYGQAVWAQEEAATTALLAAQRAAFPGIGHMPAQVLRLPHLATIFGDNALTAQRRVAVPQDEADFVGVRRTRDRPLYVPNRNAVLLSLAYAWATTLAADAVAIATYGPQTPDADAVFLDSFANVEVLALRGTRALGAPPIRLIAPFKRLDKPDIVALGRRYDVPFGLTWTCAKAPAKGQPRRPCGLCPLCRERAHAFERNHLADPVLPTPEEATEADEKAA